MQDEKHQTKYQNADLYRYILKGEAMFWLQLFGTIHPLNFMVCHMIHALCVTEMTKIIKIKECFYTDVVRWFFIDCSCILFMICHLCKILTAVSRYYFSSTIQHRSESYIICLYYK